MYNVYASAVSSFKRPTFHLNLAHLDIRKTVNVHVYFLSKIIIENLKSIIICLHGLFLEYYSFPVYNFVR